MFSEIDQMLRASVSILVVAFGLLAVPATAFAHAVYDGDWSVLILTRGGACEPSVRYGVVIAEGLVINSGGIATVQGRITPSGTVSESCGPATNGQTAPAALAGIAAVALGGANARAASAMALGWRNGASRPGPATSTIQISGYQTTRP
jgi:hypothetical protein